MLDGIAAGGSGTERRFYLEQARHYPMRRLGGEVIERAWRNARDAVARRRSGQPSVLFSTASSLRMAISTSVAITSALLGAGNCRNRQLSSLASRSTGRSCILALGVPPRLLLLEKALLLDGALDSQIKCSA